MSTSSKVKRAAVTGLFSLVAGGLVIGGLSSVAASGTSSESDRQPIRDDRDGSGSLTAAQRRVVREATDQYRDVEVAIADGYQPTELCVEEAGIGGMGYHYVNPGFAADFAIDPTLPEVLLYAPNRRGELRLVGVEYVKTDADGDLGTDDDRPSLFGEPFQGPMEGHEPGQPVHYDIHAWVWKSNPAGELAEFNPNVRCSRD
jgi:hypothetical protein